MFPARIQITVDIRNEMQNQRINKGLSLEQLAKPIGKTVSYMSAVENGRIKSMFSKDLIKVFGILFNINEEESKKRILSFQANQLNKDNSKTRTSDILVDVPDKIDTYSTMKSTFNVAKIDSLTDTINEILKKIQKKEPKLVEEILENTPQNLQFDIGFMLAIWQFPFFLLEKAGHQEKEEFLIKLANLLKEHTSARISLVSKERDDTPVTENPSEIDFDTNDEDH